jgi:predicted helicase
LPTPFETYIRSVQQDLRRGSATEHTYRPALKEYLESFGRGYDAINDPKHIDCGAPDFIIENRHVPLGYLETKDIGDPLQSTENSAQMKRYRKALNNLILSDYLDFRLYVNGDFKRAVRVAEVGKNNKLVVAENAEDQLTGLMEEFFSTQVPTINTPQELAERLASITHFIRDQIITAINSPDDSVSVGLDKSLNAFRELLLPAISAEEFADLYAQAMTYGLFAAKLTAPQGQDFLLTSAYRFLQGNRFLRRLFLDVSEELDEIEIIRPYLQDIVSLLNRADFAAILANFGRRTRTEDPVVHFYETFLAEYDPKLRQSRGVYYTPEPVVQFIVRSVDEILKTRFGKAWGLADDSVKILDPACGTGTFLYFVIQQIHEEVVQQRRQAGQWNSKARALLDRLFGFELLMAPYVVSHLKLGLLMKELGAPLAGSERLNIFLTNTLEEGVTRAEHLAGLGSYIAEESSEAAAVKKQDDIMVVLGNPPYAGHSSNPSQDSDGKLNFIGNLVRDYRFIEGASLGERNPKWLQNDYVKFIRFGEWRINRNGFGVLAFITDNSYLISPTFRGMRYHLMRTFDEIFILNLHGYSREKEIPSDVVVDENVFDITEGVAILLAIKQPSLEQKGNAEINYFSIWGSRASKYEKLMSDTLSGFDWEVVLPDDLLYRFIPYNFDIGQEYLQYWSFPTISPIHTVGIVTGQDSETIAFSKEEARFLAKKNGIDEDGIEEISYRPFDNRYILYDPLVVTRRRVKVMSHMYLGDNLGLLSSRSNRSGVMNQFFITKNMSEAKCGESTVQSYIFPLYTYFTPESTSWTLFAQTETTREPNLSHAFLEEVSTKLSLSFSKDGEGDRESTFGPEDIFYYAYAIFHSLIYRLRYAEFLKNDFPRLPLTGDRALFFALADLGKELVDYHLLRTPRVDDFITSYPVGCDNVVEKQDFTKDAPADEIGKVWINDTQYFGGVPEAVWEFKVGGYQVCHKWLKDRKGRTLSGDDINHYQRVVVALQATIRLMETIDETIPEWPIT